MSPEEIEREHQRLDLEKKKHEVKILKEQITFWGRTKEFAKSLTIFIAVFGGLSTIIFGVSEFSQAKKANEAARYDASLVRASSKDMGERITGIAGLETFATDHGSDLRMHAVRALINSLAIEREHFVQDAILHIFRDKEGSAGIFGSKEEMNEALKLVVGHNRALTEELLRSYPDDLYQKRKEFLIRTLDSLSDDSYIPMPIPADIVDDLSLEQYKDHLNLFFEPVANPDHELSMALDGLSELLSILLQGGAKASDLSGIRCIGCDLSGIDDLREVDFGGSYLYQSDFSNSDLSKAIFKEAELFEVDFTNAKLDSADLSSLETLWFFRMEMKAKPFPYLRCADLTKAEITDLPLLQIAVLYDSVDEDPLIEIKSPELGGLHFKEAPNMESFKISYLMDFTDHFLEQDPSSEYVNKILNNELLEEDILNAGEMVEGVVYRYSLDQLKSMENRSSVYVIFTQFVHTDERLELDSTLEEALTLHFTKNRVPDNAFTRSFISALGLETDPKLFLESTEVSCDEMGEELFYHETIYPEDLILLEDSLSE